MLCQKDLVNKSTNYIESGKERKTMKVFIGLLIFCFVFSLAPASANANNGMQETYLPSTQKNVDPYDFTITPPGIYNQDDYFFVTVYIDEDSRNLCDYVNLSINLTPSSPIAQPIFFHAECDETGKVGRIMFTFHSPVEFDGGIINVWYMGIATRIPFYGLYIVTPARP